MSTYKRPISTDKLTADGHFAAPTAFGPEDEVRWAKRRLDTVRLSQYADSKCGLPNTYDPTGSYLCAGRGNGTSGPCNKFVDKGNECLIREEALSNPHMQSCMYWEVENAGDPETRYCPAGKLDDKRISLGSTKNPMGFGCQNCEYGTEQLPHLDSEGRSRWCSLKGHPVEPTACCADNDPLEKPLPRNIVKILGMR